MKLDVIDVSQQIMKAVKALADEGSRLESDNLIQKKADAIGEYDKALALAATELKLKGEPVTLIPQLAKGRAGDLLKERVLAEEMLKAHYSKIDRLEAMLNGLQSVFRHLSTVGIE